MLQWILQTFRYEEKTFTALFENLDDKEMTGINPNNNCEAVM